MAKLSKEEKQEFLRLAGSAELKKDFKAIKKIAALYRARSCANDLDSYVKFLTLSNAFIDHRRKKFRRIKGKSFRI